jgi:hypothetical protein
MKSKLHITGVIIISLLTYSCSVDDNEQLPEVKNNNLKITPKIGLENEINGSMRDSTYVLPQIVEGDPSNPVPPRQ